MITLLGFIVNAQAFFCAVYWCGLNGTDKAPSWVYFNLAFSLFVYQTMDAIDGKQARRTGTGMRNLGISSLFNQSGSPLGELFDHGLDCIANAFFLPGMMMTMCAGLTLDKFNVLSFLCHFVFYCSHWVHYVGGKLTFGLIDITEIQVSFIFPLFKSNRLKCSTIGLFVISGIFGPEYWSEPLPFLEGYVQRDMVMAGSCLICVYGLTRMAIQLSHGGCGPNNSSSAGTSILSPGPNIIMILGGVYVVGYKTGLIIDHPVLYQYFIAVLAAKTTHKLVVAQMTKAAIRVADPALWTVFAIGFNQYMGSYIDQNVLFYLLVGMALLI